MNTLTKAEIFDYRSAEDINFEKSKRLYYAKVAYDHYGLAIRDNTISEIISLGKNIENNGIPEERKD
jgi:hypothetical protein